MSKKIKNAKKKLKLINLNHDIKIIIYSYLIFYPEEHVLHYAVQDRLGMNVHRFHLGNINDWDVSKAKCMDKLFLGISHDSDNFNEDISSWERNV